MSETPRLYKHSFKNFEMSSHGNKLFFFMASLWYLLLTCCFRTDSKQDNFNMKALFMFWVSAGLALKPKTPLLSGINLREKETESLLNSLGN